MSPLSSGMRTEIFRDKLLSVDRGLVPKSLGEDPGLDGARLATLCRRGVQYERFQL